MPRKKTRRKSAPEEEIYEHERVTTHQLERTATPEEIKRTAEKMGCTTQELDQLVKFVTAIEDAANDLGLSPPEVLNGCMTMIGSALKFCPREQQPDALTRIFETLWDSLELKRDT